MECKQLVVNCPDHKALTLVSHCLKECNMLHQVRVDHYCGGAIVVECGEFENRILKTEQIGAKL